MSGGTSDRVELLPCAYVLGAPVHIVDMGGVLDLMEQWIQQRQGRHWIAVTSSHGLVEAHKNSDFKAILRSADLSVPDGKWTARAAGKKAACPPKQVRGTDLLMGFLALAEKRGYTSFFYGDTERVLEVLRKNLGEKFPGLKIVGAHSPPFRELTPAEDEQITRLINQANPDVLWVGLGLPKQERWIYAHRDKLNVPVTVAVGAAFKFASGGVKNAPAWIRELGFEWLWRFFHEPRRTWYRAFVYGPQFAAYTILELCGLRRYE
jgi:N-acetylglucosaminyldiphosphoundecaprenol N-acetyl-beta-D-mannosaminyltransferase